MMAAFPKYRGQQNKPFAITGINYANLIIVKGSRGRKSIAYSAYICIFVCTNTKATYLELSSNLSTEKFY